MLSGLLGCTNSNPDVQNVSVMGSPTFLGKSVWEIKILDLGQTINITGNCDPRAVDLEVTFDGGTSWEKVKEISGADSDCGDTNFSIPLTPARYTALEMDPKKSVSKTAKVRQVLSGAGVTDAALVTLRYLAPFGPRVDGLRIVLGKTSVETSKYRLDLRAYARGAVR